MALEKMIGDIEKRLSKEAGRTVSISSVTPLGGGDINEARRLETSSGTYFMKYNLSDRHPGMFEKEAGGLDMLRQSGEIRIPGVILCGEADGQAYLLLEFIRSAPLKAGFWDEFGTSLAKMHRHHSDHFGLDQDNYMGSLHQSNQKHSDWIGFFIHERLEPQSRMAREKGLLGRSFTSGMEKLYRRLPDIFPIEPPSLVHGDLWNGNYMADDTGSACLIDPAAYYGFREVDIAMSRLFGVFGGDFYEAYNREYPLEKGWLERVDICNLYPLLVHVNLFGRGYTGSVERIVGKF